jgi:hypothetical protein
METRPTVVFEGNLVEKQDERFMHESLRPILKMLNKKLVLIALLSCVNTSAKFPEMELKLKQKFMQDQLEKNSSLRNQLLGMVIGQLNEEELSFYGKNTKQLNKRISQMLEVRILDQMGSFQS